MPDEKIGRHHRRPCFARRQRVMKSLIVGALACWSCGALSRNEPRHDPEFWLELRAKQFVVPPSVPLLPLALEATELLGSPDPKLRDEVGYEAFESWVYDHRRLTNRELDVVLFAAADLKQPFMTSDVLMS
jgi:hypothetical protein